MVAVQALRVFQCLVEQRFATLQLAGMVSEQCGQTDQGLDPVTARRVASGERGLEPPAPPRCLGPIPVGPVGGRGAEQLFIISLAQRPLHRRRESAVGDEARDPGIPAVICAFLYPPVDETEAVIPLAGAGRFELTRLRQLLAGVLPDCLEEAIADLGLVAPDGDHRLVYQATEQLDDVEPRP